MNQAIANIVKSYISDLAFVDKIAGLVSTIYVDVTDENNNRTQKSFPVACCTTADDCKNGAYNDLTPNSAYRTVIYFEDGGVTFNRQRGVFKYFTSRLRMVCWINVAKLYSDDCYNDNPCTASTRLITEIIRSIPDFPQDYSPLMQVRSKITNQVIRDNSIFGKYTYNEKQTQYLLAPYDYFALDIETEFAICISGDDYYETECL